MLKFGQMGWDIRAFGGRKKFYNLKNNKTKDKNNDKLVFVTSCVRFKKLPLHFIVFERVLVLLKHTLDDVCMNTLNEE